MTNQLAIATTQQRLIDKIRHSRKLSELVAEEANDDPIVHSPIRISSIPEQTLFKEFVRSLIPVHFCFCCNMIFIFAFYYSSFSI